MPWANRLNSIGERLLGVKNCRSRTLTWSNCHYHICVNSQVRMLLFDRARPTSAGRSIDARDRVRTSRARQPSLWVRKVQSGSDGSDLLRVRFEIEARPGSDWPSPSGAPGLWRRGCGEAGQKRREIGDGFLSSVYFFSGNSGAMVGVSSLLHWTWSERNCNSRFSFSTENIVNPSMFS